MKHKRTYTQVATVVLRDPRSQQLYQVVLEIDAPGLLDILGHHAIQASGKEARACNGDIRVRAFPWQPEKEV